MQLSVFKIALIYRLIMSHKLSLFSKMAEKLRGSPLNISDKSNDLTNMMKW